MKVFFIQIGKTDLPYLKEGISIYEKRIRHYIPFEIITVSAIRGSAKMSEEKLKESEGEAILNICKQGDYVVLLDENGTQYMSKEFAGFCEKQMVSGLKRILFLTGGAYGVSEQITSRANKIISFSRMTFSHQIIRLIFMEQFYRAMTIIRGDPYHHE